MSDSFFSIYNTLVNTVLINTVAMIIALPSVGCSTPQKTTDTSISNIKSSSSDVRPISVKLLSIVLKARHTEDLPTLTQLKEIEDYERGLIWLARFGNPLMLRIRALGMLGLAPSDLAVSQLIKSATEGKRASLKVAALRSIATHLKRLTSQDERYNQLVKTLHTATRSKHARVQSVAHELLFALTDVLNATGLNPASNPASTTSLKD
jgi:hypothetical protein